MSGILHPYYVTMVYLRAYPHVRCAEMIWNCARRHGRGKSNISSMRSKYKYVASRISVHRLGPNLAKKMGKKSGFLSPSAMKFRLTPTRVSFETLVAQISPQILISKITSEYKTQFSVISFNKLKKKKKSKPIWPPCVKPFAS